MDINANWENEVKILLENQTIKLMTEEVKKWEILKFYKDVKVAYGQELYVKLKLTARYLTFWIQARVNWLLIKKLKKIIRFIAWAGERCSVREGILEKVSWYLKVS